MWIQTLVSVSVVFNLPHHNVLLTSVATVQEFTDEEVRQATQNLYNLIGKGGFGMVYKGTLNHLTYPWL